MSTSAPLQTVAAKPLQTAGASLVLQRKCACGAGASGLTGECAECSKKKMVGLQTKLQINEPGDGYEQEADRVAEQVLAKSANSDVSSAPLRIQRYAGQSAGDVKTAPPSVDRVLASTGMPLERELREDLEKCFGHDFSRVRVHADRNAAQSTLDVDAHAYTVGQHIVFSAGRYAPGTRDGMRLIAHELTHVVQQSGAGAGSGSPSGVLQRKPRSDASPAQPDVDLVPLQGSEGAPSEADTAQAGAPEAAPVPQPDSAESLGSPPRTDTSVPAAQLPGPQAPPTELDPGAPVSEALDAATDAGTPANATQAAPVSAAPAADDSSMPRLTDLLSQPQPQAVAIDPGASPIEIASESVALDEVSQDSEVDRGALLGTLALGAGEARKTITAHSSAARSGVDRRAKSLREKVKEQTTAADRAIQLLASERRDQLNETIHDTEKEIQRQEETCKQKASEYADNAKKAQTDGFAFYRGQLEEAFNKWVRYTEKLRSFESDRLKRKIAANAKQARHLAELYDKRFIRSNTDQSEGRMEVQREAAYDVAETYAKEFEKVEPEVLSEISKGCGSLGTELAKHRDQALVDYDKGLPIVLRGIDEQLVAAQQDIASRARESRELLAKAAVEMRGRVDFLEKTALERNSAFHAKIDGQIETGRAGAEKQFRRAIPEAMEPIAAIVDEAVGLLMTADENLDPDASSQFVDEVVDFSLGAADETGAVFATARDATVGTLGSAVPFASRGLAAGKKDFDSTLRAEGAENELALTKYTAATKEYLGSSLTALDETFYAAVTESGNTLTALVNDARQKLREWMDTAVADIHQAVSDVLYEQRRALERLPNAMHNAARQAAWRYDHPYKKILYDVLGVVLGFILIVAVLVAIVATLVLLFGALAAAIFLAIVGGFLAGYFGAKAYDERRKAGAGRVSALLGAIADVTGINDARRAFTDPKMHPFERGMAWGGFWLGLFGLGSGASRFFRVIKLRLPPRFTNPFRLRRAPVPAAAAEVPVAPAVPNAKKIGFELPHQQTPKPEIPAPAVTKPGRIGFELPHEQLPAPEAPKAPTATKPREIGFRSQKERVPTSDMPEAPAQSRTPIDAPAGKSDPAVPVADPSQSPAAISQIPAAREVPSAQRPGAGATGQRVNQPARASADPADSATPRTSAGDAPTAESPTMGKVVSTVEPEVPSAARPVAAAPTPARQSTRSKLADKRVADTETALERARTKRAANEARVNELDEQFEYLKELRKALGRKRKRDYVDEAYNKTESDLRTARAELRKSRKTEADAATEANEVASAKGKLLNKEQEIDAIDRKMTKQTFEPDPGNPSKLQGQIPRPNTKAGREYARLAKAKAKALKQRDELSKDLTRTLAEHVESMVPGERAKPQALANANKYPALKPVNGRPIDVTTGKPMETDSWASDHIMSRNEIANDPRFHLLDPEQRWQMIHGIPENFLPFTKAANSSKGKKSISQWLASPAGKKSIPDDVAEALRVADKAARAAVEQKFLDLVGPLE